MGCGDPEMMALICMLFQISVYLYENVIGVVKYNGWFSVLDIDTLFIANNILNTYMST